VPPTLTIADNADGTGAVATIAGATAGATVTVYRQRVDGELGTGGVDELRQPDGQRHDRRRDDVTKSADYHWWYAAEVDSGGGLLLEGGGRRLLEGGGISGAATAISNLVYQPVTIGLAALHSRIIDAVVARIQSLALPNVHEVRRCGVLPNPERLNLPCWLVSAFFKAETVLPGVNTMDDLGYPVYLMRVSQEVGDDDAEPGIMLERQSIRRSLISQRLVGVREVMMADLEPDPVISWDEALESFQWSAMTFRFHAREVRGFGA
jgi:hypothetical protein